MNGTIGYTEAYRQWHEVLAIDDPAASGAALRPRWSAYSLVGQKPNLVKFAPKPRDIMVQCPKCKTVETLQFVEDVLTPCRKFSQRDGRVFHDCGSDLPCRLHR
jgi:phage FluMu protein Com